MSFLGYDRYGHCIRCDKYMVTSKVLYDSKEGKMKETRTFTPDHTEAEFLLDDGSKMRVCVCTTCNLLINDSDNDRMMKKVIKGWRHEVEGLDWSKEAKKSHMERYSKKKIVCNAKGKKQEQLDKKLLHFVNKKEKK